MTSFRNVLLWGGLLVLSACASQTLNPDQAPDYVITRNFTPFYTERPVPGATTDVSLQEKTRVKLLRKGPSYSLVKLEDSRTGYVTTKNISVAPAELQQTPSGATRRRASNYTATEEARARRRSSHSQAHADNRGRAPGQPSLAGDIPAPTPSPEREVPREEPSPPPATPTPQPSPVEKPKFRL